MCKGSLSIGTGCKRCGKCAVEMQSIITALEQDNQEQCHLNGIGAEREARLMARVKELEKFKTAYEEWHDKTEWAQKTATAKELGMHRADVLRERIEALEKDAVRYRFAKSNESQGKSDIVIVHKIWGGDQMYLCGDKADEAIDTAMQKD